MDLKTW